MKNMSLKNRVDLAERREKNIRRIMMQQNERMRKANAISDGAMIMTTILASMIGEEFHISAEQIEKGKTREYEVRWNEDGSLDYRQKK